MYCGLPSRATEPIIPSPSWNLVCNILGSSYAKTALGSKYLLSSFSTKTPPKKASVYFIMAKVHC